MAQSTGRAYSVDVRVAQQSAKARAAGALRYISRHITRSAAKSTLTIAVALFFVIALGWLQAAVKRSETEIDRLYDTVIVSAAVKVKGDIPTGSELGNVIRRATVYDIFGTGYAGDPYIEAGYGYAMVLPTCEDGSVPGDWDALAGYDESVDIWKNTDSLNPLLAFNDVELFAKQHSQNFSDKLPGAARRLENGATIGDFNVEYTDGYDISSFVFNEGEPIPVILSKATMEKYNLSLGDRAYLNTLGDLSRLARPKGDWEQTPVVVIGVHNSNIIGKGRPVQDAVLAPLAYLEYLRGDDAAYIAFNFEIDPEYNREIDSAKKELRDIVKRYRAGWVSLELYMQDEELKTVVGSMEQNLALLRLLYPVAIALSVAIGLGLALLLVLQNAKNAAIMRVLGSTKKRSLLVLGAQQLVVCIIGLAAGLCALVALGWGFGQSAIRALLYLAGAALGSITGGMLVTNRPPLQLLQVKE
jgi:hypothetical protein